MAREESLRIKFEAKGNKQLQQAINSIAVATKALTATQRQYERDSRPCQYRRL